MIDHRILPQKRLCNRQILKGIFLWEPRIVIIKLHDRNPAIAFGYLVMIQLSPDDCARGKLTEGLK